MAVLAILVMVTKAFRAGDWDLDLYVLFTNANEDNGDQRNSDVIGDLKHNHEKGRHKFIANQAGAIIESVLS